LRFANVFHEGDGTDAAFDDDIGRAADHDEMFDVVASNQHEAATGIDSGGVKHLQARLAAFAAANEGRRPAASANEPQDDRQKQECYADTHDSNDQVVAVCADKIFHHRASPFGLLSGK
jgi:hypothetical protein